MENIERMARVRGVIYHSSISLSMCASLTRGRPHGLSGGQGQAPVPAPGEPGPLQHRQGLHLVRKCVGAQMPAAAEAAQGGEDLG